MAQAKEPQKLDPDELFSFLETQNEYPASGYWMAEAARNAGKSEEIVQFLEAIPGPIPDEATVVKHALKPNEVPRDTVLDISGGNPSAPLGADQELDIQKDVIENGKS